MRLDDVRGQAEPKEDVTRVISLWQAGEEFRAAGGKPERGLLFIGAPGTGKTMLSKAIATSFNSPIMTMPGSGFASTFMGMDVVIVLILIGRARRLARKWGGQCIIFIDEIDAVGLRRQALGAGGFAGADDAVGLAGQRLLPRLRLPRADGRADLQRRPRARDARLAREAVRRAGHPDARPAAAVLARADREAPGLHDAGHDGRRLAGAQPAARADGRRRRAAVQEALPHAPASTRCSTRPTSSRSASAS